MHVLFQYDISNKEINLLSFKLDFHQLYIIGFVFHSIHVFWQQWHEIGQSINVWLKVNPKESQNASKLKGGFKRSTYKHIIIAKNPCGKE